MAEIDRMIITMPSDMAAAAKGALDDGDYTSCNEVVHEALLEWRNERALQLQRLAH